RSGRSSTVRSRSESQTIRTCSRRQPRCKAGALRRRPQRARRHRDFTLPRDPLEFAGEAMTAMNNERADNLGTGAPDASAAALGNLAEDGAQTSRVPGDPPSTTAFGISYQGVLLRLRHYEPDAPRSGPPVLLVHSLFKRPYVLDLLPDRSVVQSFLRQGFSVYLTDWLPPSDADAQCGLQDYVQRELANAVECIRRRERVRRVGLVGCCLGGFMASVYAALHPRNVERLVVFALPFESRPPFVPAMAEYVVRVYGNVPASWIRAGLNARV